MTILDCLREEGIEPKFIAKSHGGEYASSCPVCGGDDRFRSWPEEGQGGKWWCRNCQESGDLISYLRKVRKVSYHEACKMLGRDPGFKKSFNWSKDSSSRKWSPREATIPPDKWIEKCGAFIEWSREQLKSVRDDQIINWLKSERGFNDETIQNNHLGWNPDDIWKDRSFWGLPEECRENGEKKKVWLPSGLVIPYYISENGALKRVRIRLKTPKPYKYAVVSGSSTESMILGENRQIFVVVESELDAMLLNQEIGDLAGVIALGSSSTRPDVMAFNLLCAAELILVALDDDSAKGQENNSGAKESTWWINHFDQSRRWVPIEGKDPGEMWTAGVNLRDWVEVGIEENQLRWNGYGKDNPVEDLEGDETTGDPVEDLADDPGEDITGDPEDHEFFMVEFHSDLLGERFFLVSNSQLKKKVQDNNPGIVVYLPSEIECLKRVKSENVIKLHTARKLFGGELLSNKIECIESRAKCIKNLIIQLKVKE